MDTSDKAKLTATRYASVIAEINRGISEFNAFLAAAHQLQQISSGNAATFSAALDKPWGQQGWPSKDDPGVYVLCGHHEVEECQLGVYIGKASQQFIGHRLYAHLAPLRASGVYKRDQFIVDAILAIPINNHGARSIAVALEEFLIARSIPGVTMLNTVGVRTGA
jgi:hypothetical protein